MNRPALPWIAYPPALSKGSPVARYSSISSSLITPTWTNVDSTKLRRSPSGNRTNETPVMTECVIPESDCSICRASSVVRGLPRICVPISTAVSAAITIADDTTANASPALGKTSARRGEADASISLVVTTNPAYTTHRTETPCAKVQEPTPVRREKLEAQKRSTHGVPFTSVVILSRLKDGEGSQ